MQYEPQWRGLHCLEPSRVRSAECAEDACNRPDHPWLETTRGVIADRRQDGPQRRDERWPERPHARTQIARRMCRS
eukprot:14773417-Alexandrium_andersonii.AAC.1